MAERDVSDRILKDLYEKILVPGDIVYVVDGDRMRVGIFWNTFDYGSGWKARIRVPKYHRDSIDEWEDSFTVNAFLMHQWGINDRIKNGTTIENVSSYIVKIEDEHPSDSFRKAVQLKELMYLIEKIKSEDTIKREEQEESDRETLSAINDFIFEIGPPQINTILES